ncbi:MAG TPA: hypothetical protein VF092_00845 [Longimicrobium sp.]
MSQRTDRIVTLSGLLITIAGIIVSVTVPEVRRYFGLDGSGAQPATGGYNPEVPAFQDSTDTAVTPAPAQIGASFARDEPTDTMAVDVVVPAIVAPTDTVVESSTTVDNPARLFIPDSVTSTFRNKYRQ